MNGLPFPQPHTTSAVCQSDAAASATTSGGAMAAPSSPEKVCIENARPMRSAGTRAFRIA